MTATGRELTVVEPGTGEVLDLAAAPDEDLAAAVDRIGELRGQASDVEGLISDELVARLDRSGKWTRRVGDPKGDVQYEVKTSSPTAGTTDYDVDALERELDVLVADGEIDLEAAGAALRRRVTVVFDVPLDDDLDALVAKAKKDKRVATATPTREPQKGGIAALEKISDLTREAVERARREIDPPKRRAKVKPIRKEARA